VGGEFMLLFSTEYSFPLYGKLLRGLVFTDMGTVEENISITDWRASVGAGVRVQVDFFGPVPLEFDVAVPVLDARDDDEQIFSFFIGATF
jgi:outer membrane protein insertion porin family